MPLHDTVDSTRGLLPVVSFKFDVGETMSNVSCLNVHGDIKIAAVFVPILSLRNYPDISGVQMDLFWNGSELEG